VLEREDHVVDDVRLHERLVALDVDHDVVLLAHARHSLVAALRACARAAARVGVDALSTRIQCCWRTHPCVSPQLCQKGGGVQ